MRVVVYKPLKKTIYITTIALVFIGFACIQRRSNAIDSAQQQVIRTVNGYMETNAFSSVFLSDKENDILTILALTVDVHQLSLFIQQQAEQRSLQLGYVSHDYSRISYQAVESSAELSTAIATAVIEFFPDGYHLEMDQETKTVIVTQKNPSTY